MALQSEHAPNEKKSEVIVGAGCARGGAWYPPIKGAEGKAFRAVLNKGRTYVLVEY